MMRFPSAIICVQLLNFRLRFRYEVVGFMLHNFLTRFPDEMSCLIAVTRCPHETCRVLLDTFLMSFRAFWPYWDVVLVRFYAFCSAIFVQISWWDIMLYWVVTSFVYGMICWFGRYEMSWWDFTLFGCLLFRLMLGCEEIGEIDVTGCARLRVYDGLLDVAWFFVYKLGG